MATKYICDKCGGEKNVERVKVIIVSRSIAEDDKVMINKDLCQRCRAKLSIIIGKFMNNDEIVFAR